MNSKIIGRDIDFDEFLSNFLGVDSNFESEIEKYEHDNNYEVIHNLSKLNKNNYYYSESKMSQSVTINGNNVKNEFKHDKIYDNGKDRWEIYKK